MVQGDDEAFIFGQNDNNPTRETLLVRDTGLSTEHAFCVKSELGVDIRGKSPVSVGVKGVSEGPNPGVLGLNNQSSGVYSASLRPGSAGVLGFSYPLDPEKGTFATPSLKQHSFQSRFAFGGHNSDLRGVFPWES
jgi:hypothetical protein